MKLVSARTRAAQQAAKAPKNVLCLAIDRLNADFLGAYGNTWIETDAFDSLAADSILFDSYYATSLDLQTLYRAFWRGESPADVRDDLDQEDEQNAPVSLFRALKEKGYRTYVVSDSEEVTLHPAIEGDYCDGRFFLGSPDAEKPCDATEETKFFLNFEELAKFIAKLEDESELGDSSPWFVWAHFSGWNDKWDFPMAARERYREDEEDPKPYAGVVPPYFPRQKEDKNKRRETSAELSEEDLDRDVDAELLARMEPSDRRQSVVEAYAGGISVFDETLEGFTLWLKESGVLSKTLFVATGVRGLGTGDPSALGFPTDDAAPSPFYAEEIRLPLAIRLPDATGATVRLPALCEPRDLFQTVLAWSDFSKELANPDFWKIERSDISPFAGKWSSDEPDPDDDSQADAKSETPAPLAPDVPGQNLLPLLVDETGSVRDRVVVCAKDSTSQERAVVELDWILKETPNPKSADPREDVPPTSLELFVQPDDRYCVNDVANRCVDVVERMTPELRS